MFRYEGVGPEYSMNSIAAMMSSLSQAGQTNDKSQIYRPLHHSPTDSWEIELCVGIGIRMIVLPCWQQMQQLGRSLLIFKVHKQPQVCELFFMSRADVVATYKDRMPRNVEWTHLYDPAGEIAFWAELYKPSHRSSRALGSTSWLTDELCGGFGSRFSLKAHILSPERIEETLAHLESSVEEVSDRARAAQVKLEKARRKKDRQKERRAQQRAEDAQELSRLRAQEERELVAAAAAARIAAPALHGVDWSQVFLDRGRDAAA